MDFRIPGSLKLEHEELYEQLKRASTQTGKIGDAAKLAFRAFQPHIKKEEEFAFPPLDLLPSLADGIVTTELTEVMKLSDRMRAQLHEMLREHELITQYLQELNDIANKEDKPEYASLAKRIMRHLDLEEQVLYPAAQLIGDYVRLRLYGPRVEAHH